MAQSLTEFVQEQQEKLRLFEIWWKAQNAKNPETFPLEMADNNEGLWWEQLQEFDPAWMSEINGTKCKGASR